MYYYYDSSPLAVVRLFSMTLQRLASLPELSLFLGMALLLILVGVLSWTVRRSRKMM